MALFNKVIVFNNTSQRRHKQLDPTNKVKFKNNKCEKTKKISNLQIPTKGIRKNELTFYIQDDKTCLLVFVILSQTNNNFLRL